MVQFWKNQVLSIVGVSACRLSWQIAHFGDIVFRNPNSWACFKFLDCRWHLRRWCCSRCSTSWRARWSGWLFHIMTMTTTMATSLVILIHCLRFSGEFLSYVDASNWPDFCLLWSIATTKLWMPLNLCSGYGLGQNIIHAGVSRKMYVLLCGGRSIRRFAASCELEKCYSILLFHHELEPWEIWKPGGNLLKLSTWRRWRYVHFVNW